WTPETQPRASKKGATRSRRPSAPVRAGRSKCLRIRGLFSGNRSVSVSSGDVSGKASFIRNDAIGAILRGTPGFGFLNAVNNLATSLQGFEQNAAIGFAPLPDRAGDGGSPHHTARCAVAV